MNELKKCLFFGDIAELDFKLHPCYCGGKMEIEKVSQNGGMDGTYWNWELTCNKCGLTKTYAADGFYGRKYKTFEEVVDDWNKKFIKSLPSITPQPKTGHWIALGNYDDYEEERSYKCSECGDIDTYHDNYCPNCGVKMQEVEEWNG